MQKKYGTDDLAAVSVSLDDPNEKGVLEKVQKFLEAKKATFTNLVLDEKLEVWQDKLKIDGPPCVFVFDRSGARVKKFSEEPDYAEIEKVVKELLEKK